MESESEGTYFISDLLARSLHATVSKDQLYRLRAAVRRASDAGTPVELTLSNVHDVIASVPEPDEDGIVRGALTAVHRAMTGIGDPVCIDPSTDFLLAGVRTPEELVWGLREAEEQKYVTLASVTRSFDGDLVCVVLTRRGIAFLSEPQTPHASDEPVPSSMSSAPMIKVFISHSHADHKVALALRDLLVAAFGFETTEIRATSARGSTLPSGVDQGPTLRGEVRDIPVCIGIVTANSMASAYALFEMGARWGLQPDKLFLPMRPRDVKTDVLEGPLKDLSTPSLGDGIEVLDMMEQVARHLNIDLKPPKAYQAQLESVSRARSGKPPKGSKVPQPSERPASQPPQQDSGPAQPSLTASASTHAPASEITEDEDLVIRRKVSEEYPNDFSTQRFWIDKQRQALRDLKAFAPSDIPADVLTAIVAAQKRDYPDDFATQIFWARKQVDDWRRIHR